MNAAVLNSEKSMLDRVAHERIYANFDSICATAGLQGKYLHQSMSTYCGSTEYQWVLEYKKNRKQGIGGLVLDGVSRPDARCQAICAALVRNFIDARVIPLNTLLEAKDSGDVPNPSVLLIPNLFVQAVNKSLPAWKVQILYDVLLQRLVDNTRPTVMYIESFMGLANFYGKPFSDFLQENFIRVIG